MPEPVASPDSLSTLIQSASNTERDVHRELLVENVEFLIETLTAAHERRQKQAPVGCPSATPEQLARKRGRHGDVCRYALLDRDHDVNNESHCPCSDPLCGSDDPLDAVAAVVITGVTESPAERFFERTSRETISDLRNQYGAWEEIAQMDERELADSLGEITRGVKKQRELAARLRDLLDTVAETHYTEGITLRDFSGIKYDRYVDFLATLPCIERGDGWWLVQTAFDKPVWPADPQVDELLCSLGLLEPAALRDDSERRSNLEDEFVERLLAPLYRALATHAVTVGTDVCGEDCEIKKFLLTHRIRQQQTERSGPTAVDLFAGAGGLSCGLREAGFNIRWAIDIEPDAVATYRLNHPELPHQNVVCGDVKEIDLPERIQEVAGTPDILVGGPPCQSLSKAGYRSRRADDDDYSILDDDRTTLYTQYVNTVDELRPKAIVMENVEGMVNEVGDSGIRVIDWVLEDLKQLGESGLGYDVEYRLQDMTELGVPQKRERVLLVGIRDDLAQDSLKPEEMLDDLQVEDPKRTIQQGLSGLPRLRRGEGGRVLAKTARGSKSRYVNEHQLDSGTNLCFNHRAREHPMEKDRILFDEALSPGDTAWDVKYASDGEYAEYVEYDVGTAENSRFGDKYRMLQWSEPSPTIVAHLAKDANGYVLPDYYEHARPNADRVDQERNRGITPREAARLQSFPDDYIFLGPFTSWFRQIGNAVPPVAGKRIGKALDAVVSTDDSPTVESDSRSHDEAVSDD